jgi:hypothetical protein
MEEKFEEMVIKILSMGKTEQDIINKVKSISARLELQKLANEPWMMEKIQGETPESETAVQIKNLKKGYNNKLFRDSGVVDFEKILEFELYELGNIDILEKLEDYGLKMPLEEFYKDLYIFEEMKEEIIEKVMSFVRKKMGLKNNEKIFAKWLTTMNGILENYIVDDDFEIQEYSLPKKYLIASDLGTGGVLVLSNKMFKMEETYVKA